MSNEKRSSTVEAGIKLLITETERYYVEFYILLAAQFVYTSKVQYSTVLAKRLMSKIELIDITRNGALKCDFKTIYIGFKNSLKPCSSAIFLCSTLGTAILRLDYEPSKLSVLSHD